MLQKVGFRWLMPSFNLLACTLIVGLGQVAQSPLACRVAKISVTAVTGANMPAMAIAVLVNAKALHLQANRIPLIALPLIFLL